MNDYTNFAIMAAVNNLSVLELCNVATKLIRITNIYPYNGTENNVL